MGTRTPQISELLSDLGVVSIAVVEKIMFLNDRFKSCHLNGEEKWSKNRALTYPGSKRVWLRHKLS